MICTNYAGAMADCIPINVETTHVGLNDLTA